MAHSESSPYFHAGCTMEIILGKCKASKNSYEYSRTNSCTSSSSPPNPTPRFYPQLGSKSQGCSFFLLHPISRESQRSSLPNFLQTVHCFIPNSSRHSLGTHQPLSQGSRYAKGRSSPFPSFQQIQSSVTSPAL